MVNLLEVDLKRCFWSGLSEHPGLLNVYGEAKMAESFAEVVDRLLRVISRMAEDRFA